MALKTWQRRLLRGLGLYMVTPYLAVAVILVLFQRQLLFQPTKTERLFAKDVAGSGAEIEDVEITTKDGLILHGWHLRAESVGDDADHFLVIYFPGNAGCRADRLADYRDFLHLGCDVLLFDYRGYGDNRGSPSEERLASDAHRIWNFATDQLEFPPQHILMFGESLGGAVTVRLAAELSVSGTPPAAIILNSTFDALPEVVAWHYPAFPFRFLLWDRFNSVARLPLVRCPVLQFHGTNDDIVPIQHGRHLFAAADTTAGFDHRFITIEGGQHNFITVGMMQAEIKALLERLETLK